MTATSSFAERLVWWRKLRGLSQLQLALATACSQRHVSFLELARTQPSREMVLRLAEALDMPLRQSNALLLAAGYAPVWSESDLSAAALAPVRSALDFMLAQQEPYPAVVVDRRWNLLQANRGAVALVDFLVGPLAPDAAINLADALIAPDILRPYLVNWAEVARHFIRSVEADAAADGTTETAVLLDRLMAYPDVADTMVQPVTDGTDAPVLAMQFRKGETALGLFTTIATLGTPQDATLQELRIEHFFPMDDSTREVLQSWAN